MKGNEMYNYVINCAAGMEGLVAEEVALFGGKNIETSTGVVAWKGLLESAYRACLWSRYGSRVLLLLDSFLINDAEELYLGCKRIPWSVHLDSTMSFAVSATLGSNPVITHNHYAALRAKDGLVDFFREKTATRPNVSKEKPDIKIHLHIQEKQVSIYIDLSGESLHRRGYRDTSGIAPLKETLAAAIVSLAGWNGEAAPNTTFLDPMCGSGTLLIEAALLWGDSAPGLSRKYFGFTRWRGHDAALWTDLVEEAIQKEEEKMTRKWPRFIGYDSDPQMVAVARKNIEKAGLEEKIEVKCMEFSFLQPPSQKGFLVSNLPYGERLSEKEEVRYLYSCVGRKLQNSFGNWRAALFLSDPDVADQLGIHVEKNYRLFNGAIACHLIVGDVVEVQKKSFTWILNRDVRQAEGADFANRLLKNYKKTEKWARQNDIDCYRIYDRDLPEYNVAIDIYDKWLLVQEYMPPASVDTDRAAKRFATVLSIVKDIFQVKRDRVFLKQRQRQRGNSQYQRKDVKVRYHQVREGDCFFLVNLSNYLDTGLFLDHRPLRMKIGQLASGKRFLNLFGYTGAATVHAARGGAAATTTVDLSETYLEWARKNLALNGFSSKRHQTVRQDCLSWLKETSAAFDLIFIDPPTFANTKKKNLVFDVQKNHAELIRSAVKKLNTDGVILFSTNYRGFKLDADLFAELDIADLSRETIPFDFYRNKAIHLCWQIGTKR
ncbi:MAG: bifunctional 23S rRNA (guanine(2069)-N(7))-methyltransferase RlmK/23S rRNA (guanine(2445)-N(2))-methyltransferase RlmL [Desulfopila sp.]|jgi:23S rRNA (guanine2445-N2)-methyltransferase / 23S rRNA (guanine2069-N7)-methyltransferase|nr:bifunctional 23S rRNA (guanine(2069)-N(7))-methyltransferase RlmK/23S rRNA (guanine(2445)-N(2))-methyltransferase RlmL [Desulfopila sp.]